MIPDSVIESVRDRMDIVSVVGRHVQLKRAGRNHVGLCPFHSEKTPSFNVNPDRKVFHCFGCQEGGDVFKFLTKMLAKSFPEVVRDCAKEVGIEIPDEVESPEERERERQKNRLYAITERALHWFLDQLNGTAGADARAYLKGRHLEARQCSDFELGFGGAGRDGLWQALGKTDDDKEDLIKAGLCVAGDRGTYDRFFGRVVFPIRDEKWRVTGFGGRVFGERAKKEGVPKYLNSSESPIYDKSSALYRIPQALQKVRKGEPLVVVEGYFDAMALELCGLAAVASCGTALTPRHAGFMERAKARVVLCWDGDAAGDRAVQKAGAVLLPLKIDTRIAVLPIGDDPDTYVARTGTAGGARLVSEAESLPTWVISQAARLAEDAGDDVKRKMDAIRGMGWLFKAIPDGLEKDLYLDQAARRLDVDRTTLGRELAEGARQHQAPRSPEPAPGRSGRPDGRERQQVERPDARKPQGPPRLTPEERDVVRLVTEHSHVAAAMEEHGVGELLSEPPRRFLASVRDLVHAHGPLPSPSPLWAQLRDGVTHPDIVRILDEVTGGNRLFVDDESAQKAVRDICNRAERRRLEQQRDALKHELEAAINRDAREEAQQINAHLQQVKSRLKSLERQPLHQSR